MFFTFSDNLKGAVPQSAHNKRGSEIVGNYSVLIMRHYLRAMHSLAMNEGLLSELISMLGGEIFALCLYNFVRFWTLSRSQIF